MAKNSASAHWRGNITEGSGEIKAATGAFTVPYSLNSRVENTGTSNPEELIAAAHAGCFTMMVSALLTRGGNPPETIDTTATVTLEKSEAGLKIMHIQLETEVAVPGIDEAAFQETIANAAKNCPVSVALSAVPIEHTAKLRQTV